MTETVAWSLVTFMGAVAATSLALTNPLREDLRSLKDLRRNPVASKRQAQARTVASLRRRARRWAIGATVFVIVMGAPIVVIATGFDPDRPVAWGKAAALIMWGFWVVAAIRLWSVSVTASPSASLDG
ncbi:hypothetical protein [Nocardioides ungokensis]|uniref:hypothetical protein n=1 Tax=Nocardioides ungokensis TaxID=1643322 RepID=UPI0015DD590A|nr:hypothetical protein [Nocardioides ungokensis]